MSAQRRLIPNAVIPPSLNAAYLSVRVRPLGVGLLVIVACLMGGCEASMKGGILEPAGYVGKTEYTILLDALAIMLAIVIPTLVAALVFAWWFRESNTRARYRPRWAYSGRLELIIWSIPTLVIIFLGGVIWSGSHQLDPAKPLPTGARPLKVQVVSLDWKWLFIYPDQGIASVDELVVPAGVPVHFYLTSGTVMSMFFVPQLGSMIATMNRMVTELHLQADRPGDFYGESAQFSGDGFPDMHFTVRAVPQASFTDWVANARQAGPVLDGAGYRALSQGGVNPHPFTYRSVAPDLFQAVVSQQLPPGPGPSNRVGPSSRPEKRSDGRTAQAHR